MKLLGSVFFLVVAFSCKKQESFSIPTGSYTGNFYGNIVNMDGLPSNYEFNELNVPIDISHVTDSSVTINTLPIYRKGEIIEGAIVLTEAANNYNITPFIRGIFSKEKKEYFIRGSYYAVDYISQSISGTFEIKSDF